MTHDELLSKIAWCGLQNHEALHAVVRLHTGDGLSNRCVTCSHGNKCETIQVIEKELM